MENAELKSRLESTPYHGRTLHHPSWTSVTRSEMNRVLGVSWVGVRCRGLDERASPVPRPGNIRSDTWDNISCWDIWNRRFRCKNSARRPSNAFSCEAGPLCKNSEHRIESPYNSYMSYSNSTWAYVVNRKYLPISKSDDQTCKLTAVNWELERWRDRDKMRSRDGETERQING